MQPRVILFVGNFFFSMFTALTTYIMLPYLSVFMPEAYTGLVIAAGALVALWFFQFLPRLVARYGAQQLALVFAILEMVAFFALAAVPGAIAGTFLVALTISIQPFLYYEFDLLIEATVSEEGTTGRVRTFFLTAWNIGALSAPLLMGALLAGGNAYGRVFLAGGVALVPFIVLFAAQRLPRGAAPKISRLGDTFSCLIHDRNLAAVTFGHLVLYLFYTWAPLYVPIYLHNVLAIPWSSLGFIFSIMLLPYVLVEYPAGWIADKFIGDKELMFAGFLIAGTALASVGFLNATSSIILIACVLVASRIGAALAESMTEGHFFRSVSEQDVNSISIFRGVWPVANLIAPIIGSLLLFYGNYQWFFMITGGFVVLAGTVATFFIKDFK